MNDEQQQQSAFLNAQNAQRQAIGGLGFAGQAHNQLGMQCMQCIGRRQASKPVLEKDYDSYIKKLNEEWDKL